MPWCDDCDQLIRWVVMESGASMPVDPVMVAAMPPATLPNVPAIDTRAGDDDQPLNGLVCCQKRHDHRQYRGGYVVTDKRPPKRGWRVFRPHFHTCPNRDKNTPPARIQTR